MIFIKVPQITVFKKSKREKDKEKMDKVVKDAKLRLLKDEDL